MVRIGRAGPPAGRVRVAARRRGDYSGVMRLSPRRLVAALAFVTAIASGAAALAADDARGAAESLLAEVAASPRRAVAAPMTAVC